MNRRNRIVLGLVGLGLLLGLFGLRVGVRAPRAAEAQEAVKPTGTATYVGSAACADCHDYIDHSFKLAGRGRAEQDSMLVEGRVGCESCHGPGSDHVKADGDKDAPGFWNIRRLDKLSSAEVVAT